MTNSTSKKGITFKKHVDKTQIWSPWEVDKKNQEILVLKEKEKTDQGISLSIVTRLCSKLVTALLKLLPTIFLYAEFCSNLRNILDFPKTSLEVTTSINPLLTDIQVKHKSARKAVSALTPGNMCLLRHSPSV